jgi:hypothetical protein
MKHLNIIGAGLLLSLLATTAPAHAEDYGRWSQTEQNEDQGHHYGQQDSWHQENEDRRAEEKSDRKEEHLSRKEQKRLIRDEQRRQAAYRKNLAEQQRLAQRAAEDLRQQNRLAEYRQHQDYLVRLEAQQRSISRDYDYQSDPFYSTRASYRYTRNGASYQTNQYGAKLLRQAVDNGYAEGYRSGSAGRQDRWHGDYRDVFSYRDANYGYGGRYISQKEYNYYFRQGFQRGYRDGYDNTRRYGDRNHSILAVALSDILNLQSLR